MLERRASIIHGEKKRKHNETMNVNDENDDDKLTGVPLRASLNMKKMKIDKPFFSFKKQGMLL